MDDLEILASILGKTGDIVAGTQRDQWEQATCCPEFDVEALLAHIVGWAQVFAAAATGDTYDGDPTSYPLGDGAASDFRAAATDIVDGWRAHGTDRKVTLMSGEMPGQMVLNMTFMEYLTHGWDLATATGQPVQFTDAEAEETLRRAQQTLQPQYRGQGIGEEVEVPPDAPVLDRLVGFMGRRPAR